MDVLILAAGRGERMRPFTDRIPKPLLKVAGLSLIEHHVLKLVSAGHRRLVVNHAHLGEMIAKKLGDGSRYGAQVTYSPEPAGALDTGGGIVQALTHIRGDRFAVVNADIWTDFPFLQLKEELAGAAWLALVDNPPHRPEGDFELSSGKVRAKRAPFEHSLTFAGIAVYRRTFFDGLAAGCYPLLPILTEAVRRGEVHARHYRGIWVDVGTRQRLEALRASIARS
ncbi:MAG: N-acetylmuramate alpha-1-phosphate uridylyltransferase [Gammaproteobacteria bacterium]|nr:N-acetylmuramate alpha-1-phosphate uridylyltransferase [Gammaproteobacteria bacterium]